MSKRICLFFLSWIFPMAAWSVPVNVFFAPSSTTVEVGQQFSVDVLADIPDEVLGWGLDVDFDPVILAPVGSPSVGSSWNTVFTPDGDGLAGLVPFPGSVSGPDTLLATLNFEAIGVGTSGLTASITPLDFTEGFPLGFPLAGFAEVTFEQGSVTVKGAPEPGTAPLIAAGLLGISGLRRRQSALQVS